MRNRRHRIGDIGEAAFILRCAQLRLPLYRPLSDKHGADFLADNGRHRLRIQVKTTNTRCSKNSFHVTIARGSLKSTPYTSADIDFLVILVLPEEAFYILPQNVLRRRVALNIPSTRRKTLGPYAQYHEAWHLLLGTPPPTRKPRYQGLTLQAAADPNFPDADTNPTLATPPTTTPPTTTLPIPTPPIPPHSVTPTEYPNSKTCHSETK